MNNKLVYIKKSKALFDILYEIKKEISLNITFFDNKDFEILNGELLLSINLEETRHNNNLVIKDLPIKINELIQKINLCFLSKQFSDKSKIKIGKYILDLNARKIILYDKILDITEKESQMLILMKSKGKVSLKFLQETIWQYSDNLETHTVETHIYRLRKKFFNSFADKNFILFEDKNYFLNLNN